ncbi:hypothetical protein QP027_02530 [Corynebacterium breve]|uniref:Secreted protein n=1 Tax=Corynebacterium breve TaxID=3049799 RepID=A0ABY8VGT9_9CORY|nr:hypothetical protein [Corynebacterium breve]WIM68297.1 hypothetical protein QP027_02530 [Corynebacterium breve]
MTLIDDHSARKPLQRSKKDLIALAVISVLAISLFAIAFFSAPIRSAELTSSDKDHADYGQLAVVPTELTEITRIDDASPALKPVMVEGMIAAYADDTLTAYTPQGDIAWTYKRSDAELCSLSGAWGKFVATYKTHLGCGDVIAIDASSGKYAGTRSAPAPEQVVNISSNDRIGTVSDKRVEIWRSDLVRTVEYGEVEAPQESDMQPNRDCTITSALTRTELLAVTEKCSDETWLRMQDTTPEDSRKPEVTANAKISDNSVLVAVGQEVAAIYLPESTEIVGIDKAGEEVSRSAVQPIEATEGLFEPAVADLPNHMSFFDGSRLLLLNPANMAVNTIYEGALGTGIAIDGKLLFPVINGIAVADWKTQAIENTIPVDRGSYDGPVSLANAGDAIVEKRGDELVFLGN